MQDVQPKFNVSTLLILQRKGYFHFTYCVDGSIHYRSNDPVKVSLDYHQPVRLLITSMLLILLEVPMYFPYPTKPCYLTGD